MATPASTVKDRIVMEMRDALKAGQKVRLSALRMLSAAVKNREVEVRRELTDEEIGEVAAKEVKRRTEAMEAYGEAGRDELVEREREERDVLQSYAPAGLSDDEVAALVDEAIAATGASRPEEIGKVMGYVMGRAKGRVDGAVVQAMVRNRLS